MERIVLKIKVIIADDNLFIREGMKIILSTFPDFEVLATLQDGYEAANFCEQHEVDVALIDVRMPNLDGVEATKWISERTRSKVPVLTTFDNDDYILNAVKNRAKGYLLKNNEREWIRDADKSIYNGYTVLQDIILEKSVLKLTAAGLQKESRRLCRSFRKACPTRKSPKHSLFPKERSPIT